MRMLTLLLVAALVGVQGCHREEENNEKVRVAIDARNKELGAAFAKGDAGAIAGMYTSSAQLFPPNAPTVSGHDAVRKMWTDFIGAGFKGLELTSTEVEAFGDHADEEGTFKLTGPDGQIENGKYIVIWKRQDGQWMLHRDIWNTNAPPSPTPAPEAAEAAPAPETPPHTPPPTP